MSDFHCMVDIETLSTEATAAVLAIGAVMFNPRGGDEEDTLVETFFIRISLDSNEKYDRHMSSGTIKWWMSQSEDARTKTFSGDMSPLNFALRDFGTWCRTFETQPTRIWAKSPDFDCSILEHACKTTHQDWPFKFWDTRCVRTITELAYPEGNAPKIGVGVAHDALDDAKRQVLMVQHCYKVLSC